MKITRSRRGTGDQSSVGSEGNRKSVVDFDGPITYVIANHGLLKKGEHHATLLQEAYDILYPVGLHLICLRCSYNTFVQAIQATSGELEC